MALGDMDTALKELMILKDLAPDEAMVHFLLGRLYKNLGEKGAAVRHFTIALNLDPKVTWLMIFELLMLISLQASQQIKEAIESLEDEDEEDESSMMPWWKPRSFPKPAQNMAHPTPEKYRLIIIMTPNIQYMSGRSHSIPASLRQTYDPHMMLR